MQPTKNNIRISTFSSCNGAGYLIVSHVLSTGLFGTNMTTKIWLINDLQIIQSVYSNKPSLSQQHAQIFE